MKWKLIAINTVFIALISSFLYSAVNIDIGVSSTRGDYVIEGNYLIIHYPVRVKNGGIYPIQNVVITVEIANGSRVVWTKSFRIRSIDPFTTFTRNFVIKINPTSIYEKLGAGFVFNGGELTTRILVGANYWFFARVNMLYERANYWAPLINTFEVDNRSVRLGDGWVDIPYIVRARAQIRGVIYMEISDSAGIIAKGHSPLIVGKRGWVHLTLLKNLTELRRDRWLIKTVIHSGNFRIAKTFCYDFSNIREVK